MVSLSVSQKLQHKIYKFNYNGWTSVCLKNRTATINVT